MLIPREAYDAIVDAGGLVVAEPEPGRGIDLQIILPDSPTGEQRRLDLSVQRWAKPLSARGLETAISRWRRPSHSTGLLVVVPRATEGMLRLAAQRGVSVIALDSGSPSGHLASAPGEIIRLGRPRAEPRSPRPRGGAPAWGRAQVIRTLLLLGGRNQTDIASRSGVSQPRVSQVLKTLSAEGLIRPPSAPADTWLVLDRQRLLARWLETYPGPGGIATYWYGLEAPADQTRAALDLLSPGDDGPLRVLVSGDVAADLMAPWARPRRSVVYSRHGRDLTAAGLTPAPAQDATFVLVVPHDPGLWMSAEPYWRDRELPTAARDVDLADPLQVLYDLGQSPFPDADQAADHLVRAVLLA